MMGARAEYVVYRMAPRTEEGKGLSSEILGFDSDIDVFVSAAPATVTAERI